MTDLETIAKDAAERVHKNGGCVPQMAFAPILFALQDALSTTPARAEAQDEGAAGEAVEGGRNLGWFAGLARKHGFHAQADWLDQYACATPPVPAQDDDKLRTSIGHMSWMRKFVPCVFDVTEDRLKEIDDFISQEGGE